jgi:DNA-binding MarR family transcriptional regulator
MKIEDELKTKKFRNEQHKAALNMMFSAYQLQTSFAQGLKPFKLTAEQYNVMRILKGSSPKPLCVKEIANRLIERSSNVPRILDRLQDKSLISRTRSENDGRETLIELTEEGAKLLNRVNLSVEGLDANHVKLTDTEARLLNELLDKSRG